MENPHASCASFTATDPSAGGHIRKMSTSRKTAVRTDGNMPSLHSPMVLAFSEDAISRNCSFASASIHATKQNLEPMKTKLGAEGKRPGNARRYPGIPLRLRIHSTYCPWKWHAVTNVLELEHPSYEPVDSNSKA